MAGVSAGRFSPLPAAPGTGRSNVWKWVVCGNTATSKRTTCFARANWRFARARVRLPSVNLEHRPLPECCLFLAVIDCFSAAFDDVNESIKCERGARSASVPVDERAAARFARNNASRSNLLLEVCAADAQSHCGNIDAVGDWFECRFGHDEVPHGLTICDHEKHPQMSIVNTKIMYKSLNLPTLWGHF